MTRNFVYLLCATWISSVAACSDGSRDTSTGSGDDSPNWTTGARSTADSFRPAEPGSMAMAEGEGAADYDSAGGAGGETVVVDPDPTVPEPTIDPQPGVLTAASFDDHLYPEVFDRFVSDTGQQSQLAGWLDVTTRAVIHVRATDDRPVSNATVQLRAGDQVLFESVTGSDGRALYIPTLDGKADTALTLVVHAGDAQAEQAVSLDAAPWNVTLADASDPPKALDLAFVVDATGSMGDELEFLKQETASIAELVSTRFPDVDINYGLVVYRDEGDEYVTRGFGFTDLETLREHLLQQAANGGGDYPEAMHTALQEAADNLQWRTGNAVRMAFLLADAPPHDDKIEATLEAVQALRRKNVRLYPVAASGVAELAERVMRLSAFVTLGRYIWLTDDSGIGNPHAEPKVPCYDVELLQDLMIRMISSELAGEPIPAEQEDIIRSVGSCQ